MPIACLILDCDGVLVDSELIAARVAAACFTKAGALISAAEMIERFAGVTATKVTETVFAEHGLTAPPDATDTRRVAIMAALELEVSAMPGADEALAAIAMRKCVASSSHPDRLALILRVTGLAHHFGADIFSAVAVAHGKPAPDLFLFAAERMGAQPSHCLVVEDSVAGIAAAKAAGMAAIGFIGGGHCGPDHGSQLLAAGADRIARHLSELPAMVVYERSVRRI